MTKYFLILFLYSVAGITYSQNSDDSLGMMYSEKYVLINYCPGISNEPPSVFLSLDSLPKQIKDSVLIYWERNYDPTFIFKLKLMHIQVINCEWPNLPESKGNRYEIAYEYTDTSRKIDAYYIRLIMDKSGNIYEDESGKYEPNFPKNKINKSKTRLKDRDEIILIAQELGYKPNFMRISSYPYPEWNSTLTWLFQKKNDKNERVDLYIDAFTGEVLEERTISNIKKHVKY
jgi:hypothetical protein